MGGAKEEDEGKGEGGKGGFFRTVVGDRGCVLAAFGCSMRDSSVQDLFLLRGKSLQLFVKTKQNGEREERREGEKVFTCFTSQPIYGELLDVGKIQLPNQTGGFLDVLVALSRDENIFFLSFNKETERFKILHKTPLGVKGRRGEGVGKQLLRTLTTDFPPSSLSSSPPSFPSPSSMINLVGISKKEGTILILSSLLSPSLSPSPSSPSFLPSSLSPSLSPQPHYTDQQHTFSLSLSPSSSPPPIIWDFCLFSPSLSSPPSSPSSPSPSPFLNVFVGVICSSPKKKFPVVRLFLVSLMTNDFMEIPFRPTKKYFFPHRIVPFFHTISPLGPAFLISEPSGRVSIYRIFEESVQEIGNCSLAPPPSSSPSPPPPFSGKLKDHLSTYLLTTYHNSFTGVGREERGEGKRGEGEREVGRVVVGTEMGEVFKISIYFGFGGEGEGEVEVCCQSFSSCFCSYCSTCCDSCTSSLKGLVWMEREIGEGEGGEKEEERNEKEEENFWLILFGDLIDGSIFEGKLTEECIFGSPKDKIKTISPIIDFINCPPPYPSAPPFLSFPPSLPLPSPLPPTIITCGPFLKKQLWNVLPAPPPSISSSFSFFSSSSSPLSSSSSSPSSSSASPRIWESMTSGRIQIIEKGVGVDRKKSFPFFGKNAFFIGQEKNETFFLLTFTHSEIIHSVPARFLLKQNQCSLQVFLPDNPLSPPPLFPSFSRPLLESLFQISFESEEMKGIDLEIWDINGHQREYLRSCHVDSPTLFACEWKGKHTGIVQVTSKEVWFLFPTGSSLWVPTPGDIVTKAALISKNHFSFGIIISVRKQNNSCQVFVLSLVKNSWTLEAQTSPLLSEISCLSSFPSTPSQQHQKENFVVIVGERGGNFSSSPSLPSVSFFSLSLSLLDERGNGELLKEYEEEGKTVESMEERKEEKLVLGDYDEIPHSILSLSLERQGEREGRECVEREACWVCLIGVRSGDLYYSLRGGEKERKQGGEWFQKKVSGCAFEMVRRENESGDGFFVLAEEYGLFFSLSPAISSPSASPSLFSPPVLFSPRLVHLPDKTVVMTPFNGNNTNSNDFLVLSREENSLSWVTLDLWNQEKITDIPLLHLPRKLFFHQDSGNYICSLSPQVEQERREEKESQLFQALSNAVPYPWELPPPPLSLSSSFSQSSNPLISSCVCEPSSVPLPRELVVQKCEYLQVLGSKSSSSSLPHSPQTRFSLMEGEQTLCFSSFKQFLLVGTGFTKSKKAELLTGGRLLLFSINEQNDSAFLVLHHSQKMGEGKGGVRALTSYCHQNFWKGRKVILAGIGKELCIYFIIKSKEGFSFSKILSIALPSFILSIQVEDNNDEINVLTIEESLIRVLISQQKCEIRLDIVGASCSLTTPQSMAKISQDFLAICDKNGKIQSFGSHQWGSLTTIKPWTAYSIKDSILMKQISQNNKKSILCASFSGNICLIEEISKKLTLVYNEGLQNLQKEKTLNTKKCLIFEQPFSSQIVNGDLI